jgi:phosphomannomutase
MLYFAVKDHMADGGVMITGSHNPPDYNGFKMMLQNGPVYGDAIKELGQIASRGDYIQGEGTIRNLDIKEDYVNRLLRDFNAPESRPLNVVWDCGNGASGEIVRMLTAQLPGKHILLFDEIDGNFPNHHPDPTVDENLEDLINSVKEHNCDLGVAFDGDGDRIGAVDEQGNIFRCDTLIAIYAKDILEEHQGAPIIGDVKCSQVMYDEISRLGGQPIMWKTGHSLIKAKMVELKAPLAGELSGHIFFADKYYGFDDGIYCAIRLMNEVVDHEGPASDLVTHLPGIFNTPEIRFEVDEKRKFELVDQVLSSVKSMDSNTYQVNDIDGLRVTTPDGWWLLRASNTQNVLVTRAESETQDGLNRIINMVKDEVEKIGYGISFE